MHQLENIKEESKKEKKKYPEGMKIENHIEDIFV